MDRLFIYLICLIFVRISKENIDLGDEVDILFDPYFDFVEDENLSKLLWRIFAEQ